MITIGAGFKLSGTTDPNFSRDVADTLADLASVGLNDLDRGHIVFCKANGKYYSFDKDGSGTRNYLTGYFTEFSTGGGGGSDTPAHVFLTQASYDALEQKDSETLYFIVEDTSAWHFGDQLPIRLQ